MCRIAGILSPSTPVPELQAMVKEMCDKQQHGGPDGEGYYTDTANNLVLGHRRLALIDLSPGGQQPMSYAGERYWISYNGELYNYPEIKTTLQQAGYVFTSASDTEVVLAAFAAWGTHAFRRFNGMFAFALWDTQTDTIYLVRDMMGIKPLYYGITKEGLSFASEIRAFSAVPWLQQENKNWPVYLLAYGHIPEPVTTLQQVRPLPKGSFLRYHGPNAKWDIELFAITSYAEKIDDREEAKALIREGLAKAVKGNLISDAPIGVFLSGGVDSSIVAILAAAAQRSTLKTLSIFFKESAYSEKKYQDLVIEQLQCDNRQELITEERFDQYFPAIVKAMDMPSCDGINTWFISRCAAENGLKAVLSGIGGDELFGGYPSFRRMGILKRLAKIPAPLLEAGRFTRSKRLRRLSYLGMDDTKGEYLSLRGQFIPRDIAQQLGAAESEVWEILEGQPQLDAINCLSTGNRAGWLETNLYMQNQLLRDADVMSMAHGIEIRVPFLDREFIHLVQSIRSYIKYPGAFPKQLLIDSFTDLLPEPVWNRPKMGFALPFTEWLGESEYVKDTLQDAGPAGQANLKKFADGQLHWSQLMTLLLLRVRRDSGVVSRES